MDNNSFAMVGESYIAKKLDEMKIRYWWNPSQRNFYAADFLTEYGIIDVKIADPQTKTYTSTITGKTNDRKFWKFNCHHHGIKQTKIDVFVFIIKKYKQGKDICFVIPKELVAGKSFAITEKQVVSGRYSYFINNWTVLSEMKDRKLLVYKKKPNYVEIAKKLSLKYSRFYGVINGIVYAKQEERVKIQDYFNKNFLHLPKGIKDKPLITQKINWELYKEFKDQGYNLKTLSQKTNIPYQRLRLIIHGQISYIHAEEKRAISYLLKVPQKTLFKTD